MTAHLHNERGRLVEQLEGLYGHMVQAKAAQDKSMTTQRSRGGALMQELHGLESRLHRGASHTQALAGGKNAASVL